MSALDPTEDFFRFFCVDVHAAPHDHLTGFPEFPERMTVPTAWNAVPAGFIQGATLEDKANMIAAIPQEQLVSLISLLVDPSQFLLRPGVADRVAALPPNQAAILEISVERRLAAVDCLLAHCNPAHRLAAEAAAVAAVQVIINR